MPTIRPDRTRGPLTVAQQQIYRQHEIAAAPHTLNLSYCLLLQGPLDRVAFAASVEQLAARHEPLRTVYRRDGHEVVATVREDWCPAPVLTDLSSLQADSLWETVAERARQEAVRPFDLGSDMPIRVELLIADPVTSVLLFSLHHISSDAWGMQLLCRDWSKLYAANLGQDRSPARAAQTPAPLPAQCLDAALSQRRWLAGPEAREQERWWMDRVRGFQPQYLGYDFERLPVPYLRTSRIVHEFPAPVERATRRLQKECALSPFEALTSAFAVVLWKWLDEDVTIFGSLAANRQKAGRQGCLGAFYNTVAYMHEIDPDISVWQLVEQVSQQSSAVMENQELPFPVACSAIGERWSSGAVARLTQIMFFQDRYPAEQLRFQGIESRGLHFDPAVADGQTHRETGAPAGNEAPAVLRLLTASGSDLSFFVRQGLETKTLSVFYKTDLISDDTANWLARAYFDVIVQMAEDGGQRVGGIVVADRPAQ